MNCTHRWQPLYTKPTSRNFLEIWDTLNLGSWQQCDTCHQLGRIQPTGKVKAVGEKARSRRLADAHRWNDSVRVYHQIEANSFSLDKADSKLWRETLDLQLKPGFPDF
jgi:hypothetical protein